MNFKYPKDLGLLVIRLLVSFLIILHGIGNLLNGYEFISGVLEGSGLPGFFAYVAFFGEIVAPVLIIVGFRARLASALLAGTMLIAILTAHVGELFSLNQFGGWAIELQAFYLFSAVALFLSGAGHYSLSSTNRWD